MKKIIFVFSAIAISFHALALEKFPVKKGQINKWMIVGVRGSFNSTWLLNQNQLNDKGLKYKPSWGYSGGIMLGVHYTSWGAVCAEALYSTISQKQASAIDSVKWSARTDLAYYEFPLLLRFEPSEFKYIEAGIKIASLAGAKGSYNLADSTYSQSTISNFEKSNLSLVLGWGGSLWGDGGGLLNLGLRLTYGLSDIISTAGGKGQNYNPISKDAAASAKPYALTNTATVGFHLTYDFDLGWWFHDECKRKYKFFLFRH